MTERALGRPLEETRDFSGEEGDGESPGVGHKPVSTGVSSGRPDRTGESQVVSGPHPPDVLGLRGQDFLRLQTLPLLFGGESVGPTPALHREPSSRSPLSIEDGSDTGDRGSFTPVEVPSLP